MKINNLYKPNPSSLSIGCFITGWLGARWFQVFEISPPKIHPTAAFLHGGMSGTIGHGISYVIEQGYKKPSEMNSLEKVCYITFVAIASILITRSLVNELNMRCLKLDKINEKKIPLCPITMRDSLLMEFVARFALSLR
ncbi:MAG: hypothetical protein KFB93_07470 [Simkaniaceae bacterium]|jgi:hypothetical protein|nr:MAG: hypothetical protein KFB93_07470 [Simkaniaceae bacterium]